MSRIIIGIHGLGNKPPEELLGPWWKAAIHEGLENRGRFPFLRFRMVYWASYLHPEPFSPFIRDRRNPLFLKEPYVRGDVRPDAGRNREMALRLRDQVNQQLDRIFLESDGRLNFNGLTDFILRHFIRDLDSYYREIPLRGGSEPVSELICRRLAEMLRKHRRKKILLIAHSMGSIIAWDVLTRYVPEVKIHTLVTIGSPLGIPVVRGRMLARIPREQGASPVLRTPENIQAGWYNLADFKDRVAINYDLRNEFAPNNRGVLPRDLLVYNNYEYAGERNAHKSYGYLRCPEMAEILHGFLRPGKSLPSRHR